MYKSRFKSDSADLLAKTILSLKSEEECYRLFEDLMTVRELESLSQRIEVAQMVDNGESYTSIAEKTGASTSTISRVKKCLNYGSDGYRIILDRIKREK